MKSLKIAGAWGVLVLALSLSLATTPAVNAQSFEGSNQGRFAQFRRGVRQYRRHQRLEGVEKTAEKISNGIKMTLTSDNADTVTQLQEREPKNRNDEVTVTKENISNGVIITKTSDNDELVAKWHERADKKALKKSVNKDITNLDNGVRITLTSDNTDAVDHLQNKEHRQPRNDEISKVVTNLSNGIQIDITSSNEDLVERIQKRAEARKEGKRGRGFGRRARRSFRNHFGSQNQ